MIDKDFEFHDVSSRDTKNNISTDKSDLVILYITDNFGNELPLELNGTKLTAQGKLALLNYVDDVASHEIYRTPQERINAINNRNIKIGREIDTRWRESLHAKGGLGKNWRN